MGEQQVDRKEFIGRIGTFFIVIGLFALMIFISTDISRSYLGQQAKQTNTVYAAQAVQTREAGAKTAVSQNLPTPTLVPVKDLQATQDYLVFGVQALQTRDTGAQRAVLLKLPTPTLVPIKVLIAKNESFSYVSLFCFGAFGVLAGLVLYRMTASPAKASGRFEGLRKMRQKQREAREKREAAKKEKDAKKKK